MICLSVTSFFVPACKTSNVAIFPLVGLEWHSAVKCTFLPYDWWDYIHLLGDHLNFKGRSFGDITYHMKQ